MSAARPVRVARASRPDAGRAVRVAAPPSSEAPAPGAPPERRENVAASRRAVRLALLYALGVAAVYVVLLVLARSAPGGTDTTANEGTVVVSVLAVVLEAAGVAFALGAAPRAVVLGSTETIVVGRFGHRYVYPGRAELKWTVLQRVPAGLLAPAPLEAVEIAGGLSRRSFVLDAGLLAPSSDAAP